MCWVRLIKSRAPSFVHPAQPASPSRPHSSSSSVSSYVCVVVHTLEGLSSAKLLWPRTNLLGCLNSTASCEPLHIHMLRTCRLPTPPWTDPAGPHRRVFRMSPQRTYNIGSVLRMQMKFQIRTDGEIWDAWISLERFPNPDGP
jgi:hypothetical protein